MIRKPLPILFLFCANLCFSQTLILSGKITDENGDPLPFAHVYLENTSIGSYSDGQGAYKITLEKEGTYSITCSIIGFISKSSPVKVSHSNNEQIVDFSLQADVKALETVMVDVKRDNQWKRNYQKFSGYFLGRDDYNFQTKCTIENPYVLDFEESSGMLIAKANRPLVIKNLALGYTIKYELSEFKLNKATKAFQYVGRIFFEEIKPLDDDQASKWERNRKRSFFGSKMHFLRALTTNQLEAEGFVMYNEKVPFRELDIKFSSTRQQIKSSSIIAKKDRATSELQFSGFLRVEYPPKKKEVFVKDHSYTVNETSWLRLRSSETMLDHQGVMVQPLDVLMYGHMSDEGIARQLPTNYDPGDELFAIDTKNIFSANLNRYDSLYSKEYVVLDFQEDLRLSPGKSVEFDAWLFSGKYFDLGSPSKVLYVELIDPNCELISKTKINISGGSAKGRLNIPATLYSGTYEIRAFTEWMKNFTESSFFFSKA